MARVDPYKNFRFLVQIEGIAQAGFAECSGFGSSVEVIEYREGGDATARKLPGRVKVADITLRWGLTDSRELYDWYQSIVNGHVLRKNGSIVVLDDAGVERVRWNFFNAWPSKWDGPDFEAEGNDVAVETLVITCEGFERA